MKHPDENALKGKVQCTHIKKGKEGGRKKDKETILQKTRKKDLRNG